MDDSAPTANGPRCANASGSEDPDGDLRDREVAIVPDPVPEEVAEFWHYVSGLRSGRHPVVLLAVLHLEREDVSPIIGYTLQEALHTLTGSRVRIGRVYDSRDSLVDAGYLEIVDTDDTSKPVRTTAKGRRAARGAAECIAASLGCEAAAEALRDHDVDADAGGDVGGADHERTDGGDETVTSQ